jgi:pseudoazurin
MIKIFTTALLAGAMIASVSPMATAAEIVVNLLNKGADGTVMVFEPGFVRAAVGDTIKFVPVDKGHFVQGLPAMWPEGVADVKGKVNEELDVKVEKEGFYAFKCAPHYAMGMVALVQVGKAPVTDAIKAIKVPGPAGKRIEADLALAAAP